MDEQLNRTDTCSTPTPADSQEHFLNTLREIYLPHKGEGDGIALSLLGFIDVMAQAYISTNLANSIVFAVLIVVLLVKPAGLLGKYVPEKV